MNRTAMWRLSLLALCACGAKDDLDSSATQVRSWACDSPGEQVTYTDVAESWGLVDSTDDEVYPMYGSAVAMADFDGDGDDDVVLSLRTDGLWYHENLGDRFEATQLMADQIAALTPVDIDGDRDLDLWVGSDARFTAEPAKSTQYLLENDGAGNFSDASAQYGFDAWDGYAAMLASEFVDIDMDGDLDLVTAIGGNTTDSDEHWLLIIKRNDDGVFTDVGSSTLPVDARWAITWVALMSDFDRDLDPDLYMFNDLHEIFGPSTLHRNDGDWAFTEVTEDCFCDMGASAMGGSVGDYDGDELIDIFVTATGPNDLFRNEGDLSFTNTAVSVNAQVYDELTRMSLGSTFVDADNDGWLELIAIGGRVAVDDAELSWQSLDQYNAMLKWDPDSSSFEDIADDVGFSNSSDGRGVAVGLLDDDGYPDFVIGNLGAPSNVFQSNCGQASSLVIELIGQGQNTFGMGAEVTLVTEERRILREIRALRGYGAAQHPRAYFGLGDQTPVSLEVRWPTGHTQEVALPADASGLWTIEEKTDD